VTGYLTNELFELAIVSGPLFNGGDQFHRHIEGAGAAPLLEGQMPAWLRAAGPFERGEAAFDKGAKLGDVVQGRLVRPGVPVGSNRAGVHGQCGSELKEEETLAWVPGGVLEGLANQLLDLFFQGAEIGDAFAAFTGLFEGEGFGGAFSLQEAGPAVIWAVEFGRLGLAGAVGFAAGGAGGGEAAGQEREGDLESDVF
jgi:hypothetical protein